MSAPCWGRFCSCFVFVPTGVAAPPWSREEAPAAGKIHFPLGIKSSGVSENAELCRQNFCLYGESHPFFWIVKGKLN